MTPTITVGTTAGEPSAARPPFVTTVPHARDYKPPQPGVTPRFIGADEPPPMLQVYEAEAKFVPLTPVEVRARRDGGVAGKITTGFRREQDAAAPGLWLDSSTLPAKTGERPVWYGKVAGPLFLARAQEGTPYLTDNRAHQNIVRGWRVGLISVPGKLTFGVPNRIAPAIEVLSQGYEDVRIQEGAHISKALVAYPWDEEADRPRPAILEAMRTFYTAPTPEERARGHVPLPRLTPKYLFQVNDEGMLKVDQVPGLKAVKEGRTARSLQS